MQLPIISFYIFKKLLSAFCIVTPIIILMVWIAMSVKYINLIVSDNISFIMFFKLIICILPGTASIILPICFLISSIITFQKMHTNEEIIVFLTSGESPLQISAPLILLGIFLSFGILYLKTTASPNAYQTFEDIQEQIKNHVSINLLKSGTFNVIGDSVIYVGEKGENELKNIFISYIPRNKNSHTNIITAKNGQYLNRDGIISLHLINGYRHEFDQQNKLLSTLQFVDFSYDITPFFQRFYERPKRASEKTQIELLEDSKQTANLELKRNSVCEYHSRYISSFLPILNALIIAIYLITPIARGLQRKGSLKSFLGGVLCQALVIILTNFATKNIQMVYYNYYLIIALTIGLFAYFQYRRL